MKNLLFTVSGALLLLFVVYDVYATILHARGRTGPISETLNRSVWRIARFIASRLSRQRRHWFLNLVGPMLLPSLVIVYILLLAIGYALIYFPHMPASFIVEPQAVNASWINSLYFSGITLTTVGYGDITPRTLPMRLVALVEGASGFALISLAVTYLLTVYGALERKRAVALSFYHQAEEGADVVGFITHHYVRGQFYGFDVALRIMTRDLQQLLESHFEHPVIHFFHPIEVYRSLPRVLFLTLETCTVIRSCLDENEYAETQNHPEVRTMEASALYVLTRLVGSLALKKESETHIETPQEEMVRWRGRFRQTMERLRDAGIWTRHDRAAAWEEYRSRREEWESPLYHFSIFLGYEWEEVTGDRNLQYAADEEMEEAVVRGQ